MNITALILEQFYDGDEYGHILKLAKKNDEDAIYSPHQTRRAEYAQHTSNHEHHALLMKDSDSRVRRGLATNNHLSAENFVKLATEDPDDAVKTQALAHFADQFSRNYTSDHIEKALKIIQTDKLPPHHLYAHVISRMPAHLVPVEALDKISDWAEAHNIKPLRRLVTRMDHPPHPDLNEVIINSNDHMVHAAMTGVKGLPDGQSDFHEEMYTKLRPWNERD